MGTRPASLDEAEKVRRCRSPRERADALWPRRQGRPRRIGRRLRRFQLLKEALRFEREAAPRAATLQQLGRVCIR